MKILVLNCGSSSIKYKLFDMTSGEVMAQGGIEKIGLPGAFLKLTDKDGKKVVIESGCVNLKGLTSWEKAEALISVAHPDFREELIREADKLHIWRRSNKI